MTETENTTSSIQVNEAEHRISEMEDDFKENKLEVYEKL